MTRNATPATRGPAIASKAAHYSSNVGKMSVELGQTPPKAPKSYKLRSVGRSVGRYHRASTHRTRAPAQAGARAPNTAARPQAAARGAAPSAQGNAVRWPTRACNAKHQTSAEISTADRKARTVGERPLCRHRPRPHIARAACRARKPHPRARLPGERTPPHRPHVGRKQDLGPRRLSPQHQAPSPTGAGPP